MLPLPQNEPLAPSTRLGHRVWTLRFALVAIPTALVLLANLSPAWGAAVVATGLLAVTLYRTRRRYLTPTRLFLLKRFTVITLLVLLTVGGWEYYLSVAEGVPDVSGARSAEIAAVATVDRDTLDALTAVLTKAERTQDHKCGACGELVVRRSFGRTVRFGYLPGHDTNWYEVQYRGKHYRMPRAEFLAVVRRMGADVPLEWN